MPINQKRLNKYKLSFNCYFFYQIPMIKRLTIFILTIILSNCSSVTTSNNKVPSTLDEAIIQLKTMLSEEDLDRIKNGSEDDLALLHHGFGTGLRNSWGLWSGSSLSRWFNRKGIDHPDDMSGIIILSLYRDLRGVPRKLDEQIEYYQAYWDEVKNIEKREAELDLVRAKRRKEAMLKWKWVSNKAPTAVLPLQPKFHDIWGLEPYGDGYLVVVKKWRKNFNPVWHDGIYFLSSSTANLRPVRVESCPAIYDVVVVEKVASWLCKDPEEGWSIVTTAYHSKPTKRILNNIPDQEWLRLGKGETGLIVISSDAIYRESSGSLNKIYTASSPTREHPKFDHDEDSRTGPEYFFPHRSSIPLEHKGAIYFQVENTGNETDLYRLPLKGNDLEGFDKIFLYDYVGNWQIHTSDFAVGDGSELWIGSPKSGTLVKISNNGEVKIASLFNQLSHINSIDDRKNPSNWKTHLPTGAIHVRGSTMFLAGTNGIAKVEQGKVTPIVYFTYPNGMARTPYILRPQYNYHIKPQRLGLFGDGSFIIGDRFSGVYIIQKTDNGYEIYLPSISNDSYSIH